MRTKRCRQMQEVTRVIKMKDCPIEFKEILAWIINIPSNIPPLRFSAMIRSVINGGTLPNEDVQ